MTDEEFERIAALYGFAPSRPLREMLEAAVKAEREACAKVCEERSATGDCYVEGSAEADGCAAAIRARSKE